MKIQNSIQFTILFSLFIFIACTQFPQIDLNLAEIESGRVLQAAETYLSEQPITVTAATCERCAGGLHDYYSEGDYWWPNPDDPNGPYIRKDGMTNPNNFTVHRKAMRRLSLIVPALVSAYKITGYNKYADRALEHLKAWFVTDETKMNPNLLYAQAIKGRVTGRGIGIIDTIHLIEVAQSIIVLNKLGFIKEEDLDVLKKWFAQYLQWIFSHPYGIKERDNGNNHSTCWAMQVSSFARLTNDQAKIEFVQKMYKEVLVPDQMAADGSFPKELKRTKPYGYALFNLDAMAMVCQLASTEQENLWKFETEDGRGMRLAMQYMYPYIDDKTTWPLDPDVMYFDEWPMRHPTLLLCGINYSNSDYINLWKKLKSDSEVNEIIRNFPIRQPVLWLNETNNYF